MTLQSPVPILYEDNHLLIVDKPAGLLTQPTPENPDSLETRLKVWLKEKYQKPGNVFLGVVHRLDKPVGGIVVFAKTSKALSRLNESMRAGDFHKTYTATIEGSFPKKEGTLEHYLTHDDHKAYVEKIGAPGAKLARLHYSVVSQKGAFSIIQVKLETGRYHQIRAQCAAMGAPIVGDAKYGSRTVQPDGLIALRHTQLEFPHPITGAIVQIAL